jgi:hypothetical protein
MATFFQDLHRTLVAGVVLLIVITIHILQCLVRYLA